MQRIKPIKVADEVWIGTALLHWEQPDRESFATREIVDRVFEEGLHRPLRPGVQIHASQHCVANKRPNPGTYCMLWETGRGERRLYRHTDEAHPYRKGGKTVPARSDIPEKYWYLVDWYENVYDGKKKPGSPAVGDDRGRPDEGRPSGRLGNWLGDRRRPTQAVASARPDSPASAHDRDAFVAERTSGRSSVYDPLKRYLAERTEPVIRLSFAEIERIIGRPLPASARRHRPWWANERSGNHVHAAAWMGAGRRTANVDLNAGSVDFIR